MKSEEALNTLNDEDDHYNIFETKNLYLHQIMLISIAVYVDISINISIVLCKIIVHEPHLNILSILNCF